MPHYKDGSQARIGDKVRGRGYNTRGEVEGYVLKITPGADTCNIAVGTARARFDSAQSPEAVEKMADFQEYVSVEYGEAQAFEKVA